MNKQELIKKYEEYENGLFDFGAKIACQNFLKDLEQLDEQKPVKVPQYVAEYINLQKKNNFHVYGAMRVIEDHYDKKVPEWFYEKNIETFVRAWLDGYEVEEKKRYLVKFKGFNSSYIILKHHHYDNTWFLGGEQEYEFYRLHHTKKQLEDAGFGWVFDCEGVEVKEL